MKEKIISKLGDIEKEYNIKILLAVESGSRAWGFPSPDSDYDVRFIYVHPPTWYLTVFKKRDVIEPAAEGLLDFSGWDLKKALFLFRKSNPPLLEWIDSPMVYQKDDYFVEKMRELKVESFYPRPVIYHYLSMAEGNYRGYLRTEKVRLKKYFYVLRPLLSCYWLEHNERHPPVEFQRLLDFFRLDYPDVADEIDELLEVKTKSPEMGEGPMIGPLNDFIQKRIKYYREYVKDVKARRKMPGGKVDEVFVEFLRRYYGKEF